MNPGTCGYFLGLVFPYIGRIHTASKPVLRPTLRPCLALCGWGYSGGRDVYMYEACIYLDDVSSVVFIISIYVYNKSI